MNYIKDIHELTRQGKNICSCGQKKEMYYGPWCPFCEPPKKKVVETLNFIQTLRHLTEVKNRVGLKERIWEWFRDDIKNDSYFWANLDYYYDEEDGYYNNKDLAEDMRLLREFVGEERILFEVSW